MRSAAKGNSGWIPEPSSGPRCERRSFRKCAKWELEEVTTRDLLRLQRTERCGGRDGGERHAAHEVELTRPERAMQQLRYHPAYRCANFSG